MNGWQRLGRWIKWDMAVEIRLDDFVEVGVIQGPDGADYSIRIAKGLPPKAEERILRQMVSGTLNLRGHVYIPWQRRYQLDQDIEFLGGQEEMKRR